MGVDDEFLGPGGDGLGLTGARGTRKQAMCYPLLITYSTFSPRRAKLAMSDDCVDRVGCHRQLHYLGLGDGVVHASLLGMTK